MKNAPITTFYFSGRKLPLVKRNRSCPPAAEIRGRFVLHGDRMTTDERIWRIFLQVLALQLRQSESPNEDKEKWKQIIWKNLLTINTRAQAFNPQSLPLDLACPVPSADGRWCEQMTAKLTNLFCGVDIASTSRIEA